MSDDQELIVRVRDHRRAREWSQGELAARSGVSRTGISAIETGRSAPSTAAALSLARALECTVEDLFTLPTGRGDDPGWAWQPGSTETRFWQATVGARTLRYPIESITGARFPHDGTIEGGTATTAGDPHKTLVIAGCDPSVGLLAAEAARQEGLRILGISRSSGDALKLLRQRLVHVAGVHLANEGDAGNRAAVLKQLGDGFRLLRLTRWDSGLASRPDRRLRSVEAARRARLRWIGRETGSGARLCLDAVLAGTVEPLHLARDHRGVSEAIRVGYADAGICLRLVSDEAGLSFLPLQTEPYDLCFSPSLEDDWRIRALIRVVRSASYRRLLGDLPGYDTSTTGQSESA